MSGKRKHEQISESKKDLFNEDGDEVNFMVNINTHDDGDASDSESGDIGEDDIEDVSGGEDEEEEDEIFEAGSLDEDDTDDENEKEEEEGNKTENIPLVRLNISTDDDALNSESSDIDEDDIEGVSDGEDENEDDDGGEADSLDEDDDSGEADSLDEDNDSGEADSLDEDDTDKENGEEEEEGKTQDKLQLGVNAKTDRDSGIDDSSQEKGKDTGGIKELPEIQKTSKLQTKKIFSRIRKTSRLQDTNKESNSNMGSDSSKREYKPGIQDPDAPNEYEEDSSDEEDLRNTIGNVPIKWYEEYPHLGYDLDGKQVLKPKRGDTLDNFLNRIENPDYNRTVFDKQTGQDVRLSDADLNTVQRILSQRVPDASYDYYAPWIDHFTHEVMEMPLSGRLENKRSFIPSKNEAAYVAKRAEQIRKGLIRYTYKKEVKYNFYNLWGDESEKLRGIYNHLAAPKARLPGHGESYNPPPEYLPQGETRFKSLREVPAWKLFVKERRDRCLDLYIAPRKRIMRVTASAKDLIPVLPKPQDLRPFPSMEALIFKGHRSIIRSISIHPLGKFLASGSDDQTVKIWEISTGRCLRSFYVEAAVKWVAWNPSNKLFLLGIVLENKVIFMNPETYLTDKVVVQQTNAIFKEEPDQGDYIQPERVKTAVTWRAPTADEWANGYRIIIEHFRSVKQIVWHKQGDYFATVIPEGDHRSVLMHQLSRWRSQVPFNKCKGRVQAVEFHPKLPFLFVVTQGHVRVYNLQKQRLLKKVQANSRWVSSIAIHPGGEHFLIGCYDRKLNWFEMECTRKPHLLRYHRKAVRSVAFHRKYPLFASASDEGRVIVSHGMVYNDWLKDPFLVPLKELRGHDMFEDLCVLDLTWHPYEPFIFTSGADATIRLWH